MGYGEKDPGADQRFHDVPLTSFFPPRLGLVIPFLGFSGAIFAQSPYVPEDLLLADGFGTAVVSPVMLHELVGVSWIRL